MRWKLNGRWKPGSFLAVVGHQLLDRQRGFADQNAILIGVRQRAHLGDAVVRLLLIERIDAREPPGRRLAFAPVRVRRIVLEVLGLDQVMDRVDAETVHAAVEPEAQHREHRGAHVRIAPVEVRLLLQEGVIVVLLRRLVEGPRAAAELAHPVVRLCRRCHRRARCTSHASRSSRDDRLSTNHGC